MIQDDEKFIVEAFRYNINNKLNKILLTTDTTMKLKLAKALIDEASLTHQQLTNLLTYKTKNIKEVL